MRERERGLGVQGFRDLALTLNPKPDAKRDLGVWGFRASPGETPRSAMYLFLLVWLLTFRLSRSSPEFANQQKERQVAYVDPKP